MRNPQRSTEVKNIEKTMKRPVLRIPSHSVSLIGEEAGYRCSPTSVKTTDFHLPALQYQSPSSFSVISCSLVCAADAVLQTQLDAQTWKKQPQRKQLSWP